MEIGVGLVVVLFGLGIVLILAEVFVPGGITAAVGGILVLLSIYFAFAHVSAAAGVVLILVSAVLIPGGLMAMMKRLRHEAAEPTDEGYTAVDTSLRQLVGRRGTALSTLRPSGIARIDGRRVDVVSVSNMIAADTEVEVIRVEGNQVVVRPVDSGPGPSS